MTDNISLPREGLELALTLIQGSMKATHDTTNRLFDNLAHERDELQATLMLIRERVEELVGGRYMPTPTAIVHALYPSSVDVATALEDYISGGDIRPLPKMYEVDGPAT